VKFKEYLSLITDSRGFAPIPLFRWEIRQNARKTAREEAIAAEVLRQANPRESITGHYPWGPEQQMILQQLWIHPDGVRPGWRDHVRNEWRDVPIAGGSKLYSVEETEFGELPVPNAVKEPGVVVGSFADRIKESLGE